MPPARVGKVQTSFRAMQPHTDLWDVGDEQTAEEEWVESCALSGGGMAGVVPGVGVFVDPLKG